MRKDSVNGMERDAASLALEDDAVASSAATGSSGAAAATPQSPHPPADPALDALVREIIARIADKWTMQLLETLAEHGRLRFTRLAGLVAGISQKMLTKTLRQMEADGLVARTVHAVVPPRVEYELTDLGRSLGQAFCGVWLWAERHREAIEAARKAFRERGAG